MSKIDFIESSIALENERVLLRPLVEADFEHLLPFAINEPELWTYSLQEGGGKENLIKYFSRALEDRDMGASCPFIVYDKQKESYAGSTRFYDIQPHHKTAQLGFTWYGKDFQRTGLNRHCKYLMLSYAFESIGIERLEFRADATNARSVTAMKAIGCTFEGILRSNCTSPTGRRDSIVLSILKNEWLEKIKSELFKKIS